MTVYDKNGKIITAAETYPRESGEIPEKIPMIKPIKIYDENDVKAIIKELHNISRELNTLNSILRRK